MAAKLEKASAWLADNPAALWAALAVGVLGLGVVTLLLLRRRGGFSARTELAFALVQIGVAVVMITGTYEFFRAENLLAMPVPEAIGAAIIIEACAWVCIGMIWSHAEGQHEDPATGETVPNVGTGPGGYGFALITIGGGTLAVFGSSGVSAGIGRAIIVAIGVTLWWMRILTKIRRANRPGRFMYSPYRIALRRGWVQVTDDDVDNIGHASEWQVRQLARAMRLAGHRWSPLAWWGGRSLIKLQDSASQKVLLRARNRYVQGLAVREQVRPNSPEMQALVAQARCALDPEAPAPPPPTDIATEVARQVAEAVRRLEARRPPERPAAPRGKAARKPEGQEFVRHNERGQVTGTVRVPARLVGDKVLAGEDLKVDARDRVAGWLAERLAQGIPPKEARDGLGTRLARSYDPPFSDRWGQGLVAEVPDPVAAPSMNGRSVPPTLESVST